MRRNSSIPNKKEQPKSNKKGGLWLSEKKEGTILFFFPAAVMYTGTLSKTLGYKYNMEILDKAVWSENLYYISVCHYNSKISYMHEYNALYFPNVLHWSLIC